MPNNNEQRKGSALGTAATFLVGAVAGAALAYFSTREEEAPNQAPPHQHHPARSVPVEEVEDEKEDGKAKEFCEVCLRSYEHIQRLNIHIVSTPCGHVYCRDCIDRVIDRSGLCPHCRSPIGSSGLRRIYL